MFFLVANIGETISRVDGLLLSIVFIVFILYTIKQKKKSMSNNTSKSNVTKKDLGISILKVILGIILLKYGADISVDNAVSIAKVLGVSEKVIGVTIVAIGTSLPELITSVVAGIKGEIDIAIGNIVGSNIFNLLFILGVSSIITPISYSLSYNTDFLLLIFVSFLLLAFAYFGRKNTMTRLNGVIYLLIYSGYIAYLII